MRLALGARKVDQKWEKGVPESFSGLFGFCFDGFVGLKKELNRGYWNRDRPSVAEEVQRGRMRLRWLLRGFRGGIAALKIWGMFIDSMINGGRDVMSCVHEEER